MTEQTYDPKAFALELGFSEEDAELFAGVGANATNLRRLAKRRREKGRMPDQLVEGKAEPKSETLAKVETKLMAKHRHFYRKDATCTCGAIKGVKGVKQPLSAVKIAEKVAQVKRKAEAKARAEAEAEAANTPTPPADVVK